MLNHLETFINGIQTFEAGKVMEDIVDRNKEKIVELQQEQLAAGIDSHGQKRIDEYRPFTIEQKEKYGVGLGEVTDRVTFFMTGELYSSLMAEQDGSQVMVKADSEKFDKMLERIGDDNYGLDDQSCASFAEEITFPQFKDAFNEATGLAL